MKTSQRIDALTTRVKSSFTVVDAIANASIEPLPSPGNTPAARIAAAIKSDQIASAAPAAVERIRDRLKALIADADATLEQIATEAAAAQALALFIIGKGDMPDAAPEHIKAAAMTLRGQPGSASVARQLQLAAENAASEVERLKGYWLPATKHAATIARYKSAARIFKAAGPALERRATAAQLMAERNDELRRRWLQNARTRRIGQ